MKDIVEKIIGYDIEAEHEKEIKEIIKWFDFSDGSHFRINKNFAHQTYELYPEGSLEPLHIIPIRVIYAIDAGSEYYIYCCRECLDELKNHPPDLTGFPHEGTDYEKTKWGIENWRKISPLLPPSSHIGHSIVLRDRLEDGTIRRETYCTKPHSTHNLVEFLTC